MKALLKRDYKGNDCTLGKLYFGTEVVEILELPWRDNIQMKSCIPTGVYKVKKTYSPRFRRNMWEVLNVPDRAGIRIHPANTVQELAGCLAPGLKRYDINKDGIIDVTDSRKAMSIMLEELPDEFELEIIWKV